MPTRIRIDPRLCKSEGRRILTDHRWIHVFVGGGFALLMIFGLVATSTFGASWQWPVIVGVILGSPLLASGELALYAAHTKESLTDHELLACLTPRKWAISILVVLTIGVTAVAISAVALFQYLYPSAILISLSFAFFGETTTAILFGRVMTATILGGASLIVGFGWLLASLHVVRDGSGPLQALRRSWNTTYGSKRTLLRIALPVWAVIACYTFTAYFPLWPHRTLAAVLKTLSIVPLLTLGAFLGPRLLAASVAGYAMLERQRAEEKREARNWLRPT